MIEMAQILIFLSNIIAIVAGFGSIPIENFWSPSTGKSADPSAGLYLMDSSGKCLLEQFGQVFARTVPASFARTTYEELPISGSTF